MSPVLYCYINQWSDHMWNTQIPCGVLINGDIKELEKILKRATKLVINFKRMPYKDRLMHLNLPTLKYRRLRGDMIEVFKIMHNVYDSEVSPNLRYYPKGYTS